MMYRVFHELEKKLGRLKRKHPAHLKFQNPISLDQWRQTKNAFVIDSKQQLSFKKNPSEILKQKLEKILVGEFQYFNAKWIRIGKNYDWVTNPSNGYRYDAKQHWSEICRFNCRSWRYKICLGEIKVFIHLDYYQV
ncbi:hypothetical protein [Nitritalea halalkaliphila]|uniref:hypothetical protein n=1 Tax=Nitritalea halalkaliphila TaxID=590849 RepID=UPI001930AB04|nr:hypothetical protein [Nitritalea halalkaliphila]